MDTHNVGQNDVCYFAVTNFRGQNRRFGIRIDDRRRHMYVIGKTGMGKSTMMENMIVQDIREGRGVGIVDPHGDLAEKIIEFIPSHRLNDVVYFNPADVDYPIAFNILENVDDRYKHLVASGLMGVFTKIWANVWSARMEYILSNCILALLDSPGNTLLGINRVLVDKVYRHKIVSRITDPVVRSFWVNEYANYSDKFRTEAIAPIQNKVGQFLSTAIVRNIVGQTKSTIDLREIMDNKKILIMNLAKGRIGEDNSALLGAMMITKLQVAAMSRVDVPEHERQDFFLYVDEFQNFATTAFADILSEARKYRLSLIMAHQYIEQLDEKVAAAVFGNVGTIACFRIGATDAEELVKEFTPHFTEEDLVNLTKFEIYLRLMINGVASRPFSASSLPPLREDEKTGNKDTLIQVSHERYSRPRAEVEEKIIRWTGVEELGAEVAEEMSKGGIADDEIRYREGFTASAKPRATARLPSPHRDQQRIAQDAASRKSAPEQQPSSPREKIEESSREQTAPREATCDNCGRGTLVTFEPDDKRNVFCKKCLKLFKKGLIDVAALKKRNVPDKYDDLPPLVATGSGIKVGQRETAPSGAGRRTSAADDVSRDAHREGGQRSQEVRAQEKTQEQRQKSETAHVPASAQTRARDSISLEEAVARTPVSFHTPHDHQRKSAVPASSREQFAPDFSDSLSGEESEDSPDAPHSAEPAEEEHPHLIRGIPPGKVVSIHPSP